jgi:hypothetical protein
MILTRNVHSLKIFCLSLNPSISSRRLLSYLFVLFFPSPNKSSETRTSYLLFKSIYEFNEFSFWCNISFTMINVGIYFTLKNQSGYKTCSNCTGNLSVLSGQLKQSAKNQFLKLLLIAWLICTSWYIPIIGIGLNVLLGIRANSIWERPAVAKMVVLRVFVGLIVALAPICDGKVKN